MPLPSHKGSVTGRFQYLRNSYAVLVKVTLVSGNAEVIYHVSDTCLLGI